MTPYEGPGLTGSVPPGQPPTVHESELRQGAKERPHGKGPVRELLETILLALIIFLLVRTFVMNYRVIGQSMQPTIEEGQYLLIDKLLYRMGTPSRGDIVVLHPPNLPGQIYVKRIIGLSGDVVEIRNGALYINNQRVNEPWTMRPAPGTDWGPAQIGHEEFLVLGDNRPGSRDSRYFGMVTMEHILGRAIASYWPPAEWSAYPRYRPEELGLGYTEQSYEQFPVGCRHPCPGDH